MSEVCLQNGSVTACRSSKCKLEVEIACLLELNISILTSLNMIELEVKGALDKTQRLRDTNQIAEQYREWLSAHIKSQTQFSCR